MKSTLAAFLCVAVVTLIAAPRADAASDDLEALLSAATALAPAETHPAVVATEETPSVDASRYSDHAPWQVAAEIHPAAGATAGVHTPADHKPSPASPINAVPEPSAIILALAALGYFLLFGRRRRVI